MVIEPQKIFVPLTINQLREAHAFLRDQTEDSLEGYHPQFYGTTTPLGVHRGPVDTHAEWTDPEDELIELIDSAEDCMGVDDELAELARIREALCEQQVTCSVSTLIGHLHPADGEDYKPEPTRINGFRRSNGQRSCLQVGIRRFLYGMSNSQGLCVEGGDGFCSPSNCWKDNSKSQRQHLRHPRRIIKNVMTADSAS